MAIRTIRYEDSLETVWEECVYTLARLSADSDAKDLAKTMSSLVSRTEQVMSRQREMWRREIIAQAGVDAADDGLDDAVEQIATVLLQRSKMDRNAPLFRRFFPNAPSLLLRMGLESQLEKVRSWPASLRKEKDRRVTATAASLEKALQSGRAALEERDQAAAERSDQRLREIVRLIDDVNNARLSLYSVLLERGIKRKKPRDWAGRFFRKLTREPKPTAVSPSEPAPGTTNAPEPAAASAPTG